MSKASLSVRSVLLMALCAGTALPLTARADDAPATAPKLSLNPFDNSATAPAPATHPKNDVYNMTIDELLGVEIYSAARQKRRVVDSPAAVSVITQEDIARSHYQSIPELLRLAPGVNVQQLNAGTWTVGMRGFAYQFADNTLVMMDGRSVYSPVSSGVYWNAVDYVLPDIDRIEVVRGPGAALWGANAMNGVINIITKDAKDTQGLLWDSYAGTDGYINSVRYGGKIGDLGYFRVYAKQRSMNDFMYDPTNPPLGTLVLQGDAHDGWDQQRSGFRADLTLGEKDALTVQGDLFNSREGGHVTDNIFAPPFRRIDVGPFDATGGNVLARWTHTFSPTSDLTTQLYVDNINDPARYDFGYESNTITADLDFQHHFLLGDNQDITWGGEYRFLDIHTRGNPDALMFTQSRDLLHLGGLFVQDDVTLIPERLHVVAGAKLEYYSLAAAPFEFQPSLRLLWTPDAHHSIWAAVSRAARTPNLTETQMVAPLARTATTEVERLPNPEIRSIGMIAYEAGYRTEIGKNVSLDLSTFYNIYDHRRAFGVPLPTDHEGGVTEIRNTIGDDHLGQSWGAELATTWNVNERLSLRGSYTFTDVLEFRGTKTAARAPTDPQNQVKVQGHLSINKQWSADSQLYWTDQQNFWGGSIPPYWRWDASVTWKPFPNAEVSAGIWNLLDNAHPEGYDNLFSGVRNEIPRTFFIQVQVRF